MISYQLKNAEGLCIRNCTEAVGQNDDMFPMDGQRQTGISNGIKTYTLGYGIIMENIKIVLSDNQMLLIDHIYDTPCSWLRFA